MTVKAFLKRELDLFTRSFVGIDRRFLYVFLFEVLLISAILLSLSAWQDSILSIGGDIASFRSDLEQASVGSLYAVQMRDDVAVDILGKVVTSSVLLGLFIILAWTLIKQKVYCVVNRIKFTKAVYWRFLIASLVWVVVSFFTFASLQYLIYLAWGDTFDVSFASRVWVLITMTLLILILYWFAINIFTSLVRKGTLLDAMKGLYNTGIKNILRIIVPMIFSLVLMILLNVCMLLFVILTWQLLFVIGSAILLLLYFTFLRFYYTAVIDDCLPKKRLVHEHKVSREKKIPVGSKKK